MINPFFGEMLAKVVVFARQVNISIGLFENHLCCADIILACNDADTGLKSPSVGHIVDMEKFVKIFLSVKVANKVLDWKF